jgi:hypothetical protein
MVIFDVLSVRSWAPNTFDKSGDLCLFFQWFTITPKSPPKLRTLFGVWARRNALLSWLLNSPKPGKVASQRLLAFYSQHVSLMLPNTRFLLAQ